MKIKYSNFDDVNTIVANMLGSKEMKKAITRNNLYKFWKTVVGKKLGDKSKPFGMFANGTLIIACQSPMVAQELIMRKSQILEKMQPYLKSLYLKVNDLKFDPKKWGFDDGQSADVVHQPLTIELANPTDKELLEIVLDEAEILGIKKAIDSNEFASAELRSRMFEAIERDLKIQKFRENLI